MSSEYADEVDPIKSLGEINFIVMGSKIPNGSKIVAKYLRNKRFINWIINFQGNSLIKRNSFHQFLNLNACPIRLIKFLAPE